MRGFRLLVKWLGRLAAVLFTLLLLTVFLVNLPPVQQFLTSRLASFVTNKTHTRVEIGAIRLALPKYLLIEKVFLEDQQQDTLLYCGRLKVDFNLGGLLQRRLQLNHISLKELKADLHPTPDSVMNFQFLIDAFAPKKSTPKPTPPPEEKPKKKGTPPFRLEFKNADIALEKIDLYYTDPLGKFEMDVDLGQLGTQIRTFDLSTLDIDLEDFFLKDTHAAMQLGESTPQEDTTQSSFRLKLSADNLSLDEISYALDLPGLQLYSALGHAESQMATFYLAPDTMDIKVPHFKLAKGHFAYDNPTAAPAPGFDYNHMDIDSIHIEADSLRYHNLDIYGKINQIAAREKSGIDLQNLKADHVHYNLDTAVVSGFQAQTSRSKMVAEQAFITFPFIRQGGQLEDMALSLSLNEAKVSPEDALLFVPMLAEYPLVKNNRKNLLTLNSRIEGTLGNLQVKQLDLRGWGLHFNAAGNLRHPTIIDQLQTDLQVHDLEVQRQGISNLIPAGILPETSELPSKLSARGRFNGSTHDLNLRLEAMLSRPAEPVSAILLVDGRVRDLLNTDKLSYDLNLDTLFIGRSELMAYLPASALPDSIELPQDVQVRGSIGGSIDSINTSLQLEISRGQRPSRLQVDGFVAGFPKKENLHFDLTLDSIQITRMETGAYLHSGLWPDYLNSPAIRYARLSAAGKLNDLKAEMALTANFLELNAQAALRDSSYSLSAQIDSFDLAALFKKNAYDSLIGRDLSTLAMTLEVQGSGFDPKADLKGTIGFRLRPEAFAWQDGLILNGAVDRRAFQGKLYVQEKGAHGNLDMDLDFNLDSASYAKLALDLQQLDLRQLRLREKSFAASTKLSLETQGISTSNFAGDLRLRNFNIQVDSVNRQLDSLLLSARFIHNRNEINLQSDLGVANLSGEFAYPQILQDLRSLIRSYFDPQLTADSLFVDSHEYFTINVELDQPLILSTGLIPGLEDLDPSTLSGSFDGATKILDLEASIPHIRYRGVSFDSLALEVATAADSLSYVFGFKKMEALDQFKAINLSITGEVTPDGAIENTLQQFDSTGQQRFWLQSTFAEREGITTIYMTPRALLNYSEWQFEKNNLIRFEQGKMQISNWQAQRENQVVSLGDRDQEDLLIDIRNFDLQLVSDIIKYNSSYLRGTLNGNAALQEVLSSFSPSADIEIQDFGVLGASLGHLSLDLRQDQDKNWTGNLGFQGNDNDVTLEALYRPADTLNTFDARLNMNKLNLAALEPLSGGSLQQMKGAVNGSLHAYGSFQAPRLEGQFQFQEASMRPTYLQTTYTLGNQPVVITTSRQQESTTTALQIQNFTITDQFGQRMNLTGGVEARDFTTADILVNLSARNFTILNTKEKDNPLFYGRLNVDVNGFIGGRLDSSAVSLNVTPRRNSEFTYILPLDQLQDIESGEGVIEFVSPDSLADSQAQKKPKARSPFLFDLSLNAKVNDSLNLKIIVNPVAGDNFEGKGTGELTLHLSPRGDIDLGGRVEFLEGEYLFTYTELIRRRFEVKPGSSISWIGDPLNPELAVTARYVAKASPLPLFTNRSDFTPDEEKELGRRQEFYANFIITDELEDMEINTEIEYPKTNFNSGNYQVENAVKQLNQDPSQTTSQAFSLLLFNSFTSSDFSAGTSSAIDFKQSFNDLLTSYLNNIADEYIKFVELDFGIESSGGNGDNYFDDTDFRVSLKKKFLDNRLEIRVDGIASTREDTKQSQDSQMQAYLDNITVEYTLTKDGVFKVRLFNQRDVEDFLGGEVIKLGGALVFSKNFKKLKLFTSSKNKKEPDD